MKIMVFLEICDEPNEEYVKCPPTCPPQTCESINKTYFCPLIKTKINKTDCVGECRCIEGYYRNLIGECITKDDCCKFIFHNSTEPYFSQIISIKSLLAYMFNINEIRITHITKKIFNLDPYSMKSVKISKLYLDLV